MNNFGTYSLKLPVHVQKLNPFVNVSDLTSLSKRLKHARVK